MPPPRIAAVSPLPAHRLLVTFVNGVQKVYDCTPLLHHPRFQQLQPAACFNAVQVDPGGYGVSWDEDTDLSEYELWQRGVAVATAMVDQPDMVPSGGRT